MQDSRETLYASYVSNFKAHEPSQDAERYEAVAGSYYGRFVAQIDKAAPVLELGCGAGSFIAYLQRRGFEQVEGVDASQEQVDSARSCGLSVRVEDIFDALTTDREYGLIAALDLIEHLTVDELLRLLDKARGRLLPDGALLIRTPNGQGLFPGQVIYGDLTHTTILNPQSLAHALRAAGFGQIEIREVGPPSDRPLRRLLWRLIKIPPTLIRLVETGKRQRVWSETMICFARPV